MPSRSLFFLFSPLYRGQQRCSSHTGPPEGRSSMVLLNSFVWVTIVSKGLFNNNSVHTLVSSPCRRSILCMLRSMVAWHVIGSAHSARNHPLSPSRSRSPSYQPRRKRKNTKTESPAVFCHVVAPCLMPGAACSSTWKHVGIIVKKKEVTFNLRVFV